jgi:hypothetical protein
MPEFDTYGNLLSFCVLPHFFSLLTLHCHHYTAHAISDYCSLTTALCLVFTNTRLVALTITLVCVIMKVNGIKVATGCKWMVCLLQNGSQLSVAS